jgi:hypothetical protein
MVHEVMVSGFLISVGGGGGGVSSGGVVGAGVSPGAGVSAGGCVGAGAGAPQAVATSTRIITTLVIRNHRLVLNIFSLPLKAYHSWTLNHQATVLQASSPPFVLATTLINKRGRRDTRLSP